MSALIFVQIGLNRFECKISVSGSVIYVLFTLRMRSIFNGEEIPANADDNSEDLCKETFL